MPTGIYERKRQAEQYVFNCGSCGEICRRPMSSYKGRRLPQYCSSECFGNSARRTDHNLVCQHCTGSFRGRSRAKFCSTSCAVAAKTTGAAKWDDPAYRREYHRQYALKQRALGGFDAKRNKAKAERRAATKAQVEALLRKANGLCVYCGEASDKLTIDHATPIHAGGRHNVRNLVPCCKSCNSSKGTKDLADWLFDKHGIYGLARTYTFLARKSITAEFYSSER